MKQRGMSLRALAKAAHCDASYLSKALRGLKPLGPKLARDIDGALGAGGEIIQAAARRYQVEGPGAGAAEAREVMSWVTATNTSDDAIEELSRNADYLADAHARLPAATVLREVLGAHRAVQAVLRGGRQRLAQARELVRADSALLAHACLLLGDLGRYEAAREYGSAALLCAQEAEADEGLAWTAMAKTARWQDRFTEAAGLAARGFGASRNTSVRAELAYREANAIALFGDGPRAREALARAVRASESLDDDGTSAWSFSRGRQAVFTVSVCNHIGDPDGALRAARDADAYWASGGGKATATWAQVRAGAAIAHVLKDSLDGAAGQLAPVLGLSSDQRIRTVTGYLDEIGSMLQAPRFAGSRLAAQLGEQIREFNAGGAAASMSA
jgi:transcriptional regulator with XRE-family HTH domain